MLSKPENKDKYIEVNFSKSDDQLHVTIIDMGEGFDFEKYLVLDKKRMFHTHGKGIIMAKNLYFDQLSYIAPETRFR